jgi:hypothetical protein
MRPDLESAIARVIALRAEVAELPAAEAPLLRIEDALCAGYAQALEGDAWLSEIEQRLQVCFEDTSLDARRELRRLAVEHAEFMRRVIALRRELAGLRRAHDRLRGHAQAGAS